MNPFEMLHDYRTSNAIGRDDITTAAMLVEMARRDGAEEPQPLAWVAFCLALRTVRDGHTCVDLDRISLRNLTRQSIFWFVTMHVSNIDSSHHVAIHARAYKQRPLDANGLL